MSQYLGGWPVIWNRNSILFFGDLIPSSQLGQYHNFTGFGVGCILICNWIPKLRVCLEGNLWQNWQCNSRTKGTPPQSCFHRTAGIVPLLTASGWSTPPGSASPSASSFQGGLRQKFQILKLAHTSGWQQLDFLSPAAPTSPHQISPGEESFEQVLGVLSRTLAGFKIPLESFEESF